MNKKIWLLLLCLVPSLVFAANGSDTFPIGAALFMEAFVTIHMTVFVLVPVSNMLGGNNSKKLLAILFVGRLLLLLYFDIFVTTAVAIPDFLAVFIGAFLVVPLLSVVTGKHAYGKDSLIVNVKTNKDNKVVEYNSVKKKTPEKTYVRCSYCGRLAQLGEETCDGCGAAFTEHDVLKDWR